MEKNSRNFGLEVVRSIAIISVVTSHLKAFATTYDLRCLGIGGLLGVEIFFVLSGFLIGQIILRSLVKDSSINSLKKFYIRRWFRTLPLYYLMLFAQAAINNMIIPKRNFIFLQNFNENALSFLAVSWSLSIEEWFYLLFPAILILFLNIFNKKIDKKNIFFIISIFITLVSFILRLYIVAKFNPSWDYGVRKEVFLRMDSMMFGVILAGINVYYKDFYKKITSSKIPMIVSFIGFITIGIVHMNYIYSNSLDNSLFARTIMFSFISLICMFFVAWMESSIFINNVLSKWRISKIFIFFSSTSYAIYFVHWIILGPILNKFHGLKGACLLIFITLIVSWLLHILYEIPMMNLRDEIDFKKRSRCFKNAS